MRSRCTPVCCFSSPVHLACATTRATADALRPAAHVFVGLFAGDRNPQHQLSCTQFNHILGLTETLERPAFAQLTGCSYSCQWRNHGILLCLMGALLAEYAGAVLGVLSAALYGRKVNIWKKIGGLAAMLVAYYLLSIGWSTRTHSPLYSFGSEPIEKARQTFGVKEMVVPITAGILSALRRVLARRVSLKNQLKRRLHAITIASATCFLFPFAMWDTILGSASDSIVKFQLPNWAYLSTVLFGMVLIFYVDNVTEEKLHLVFSSPRHLMVSTGCIIVLEIVYQMDFSLFGFLVCSVILGLGIFETTSLERSKKSPLETHELSNGVFHNQLPITELPS
ncbi:uncharacterized protein LOC100274030 [Zea mays]|uniref:Zinc transporter 5 n=1 Tax=Zea mays TaxID=4577 RepID=B4FYP3_MAIZE|nr:uncharacterized protein LOC100274030 [Zea mays]ACF87236.1 unknown [Zea mays]|eukprot:NP_001141887.1 hypothetical protein [Zea mays]